MVSLTGTALLVASCFLATCDAAIIPDEITHLPGYGRPKTKHYSGYLEVDDPQGKMYYHYWLTMSQSPTATTDPVALWLNGGPGASSIGYGFFSELGPYMLTDESFKNKTTKNVPDVFDNPHSWNKYANMLFMETPPGVGYSYCGSGTGNGSAPKCKWNDETQAVGNYNALLAFFDGFPELKDNEFFITGESYGGMYVPTLVEQVQQKGGINLKGFAVGNGVIGHEDTFPGDAGVRMEFLHNSRFMSEQLWQRLQTECGKDFSKDGPRCLLAQREASEAAGDFYIYNVYDTCGQDQVDNSVDTSTPWLRKFLDHGSHYNSLPGGGVGTMEPDQYPCGRNRGVTTWINLPEVREAIHMKPQSFYGHPFTMEAGRALNYQASRAHLMDVYPKFIAQYRTLIYNGDFDGCVPYLANQGWTYSVADKMGWTQERKWQPWEVNGQVAGYITTWRGAGANNFSFATVKGSGHMVPQYKARQALVLFKSFIEGHGPLYPEIRTPPDHQGDL